MKIVMALLLGLAALASAVSFATDLTAEQILAKVSQTYGGLTSFRFVERQESKQPVIGGVPRETEPFDPLEVLNWRDLTLSTPGKIRLVFSTVAGAVLLVSDGQKTVAYIPSLREYGEAAAAPLVQELWRHPIRSIGDDLALYRSLSDDARGAKLRGEETLSLGDQGVQCYVVDVRVNSAWRRLWVDEQRFIVLQDRWTYGLEGSRRELVGADLWTRRLTGLDLGPTSDGVFQSVVPSGTRRVDLFGAPAGPAEHTVEVLASLLIGSEMQDEHVFQLTGYGLRGRKARDFTVGSLGGAEVRLDRLRDKIVVLDFWASWCQPCQEELAAIQKLHNALRSKGVVFLGIDGESPDTVQGFVKAHGYTFPMLLDSNETVHGLYGVRLVPTTVVINRKGKIAAHYVGAGGETQLRKALRAAGLNTTP
jgi:peroxiredoxin/outer membrane lipoprotein-sorting protein